VYPNEPCNCQFQGERKWLVKLSFTNRADEEVPVLQDCTYPEAIAIANLTLAASYGARPAHVLTTGVKVDRIPNTPCPGAFMTVEEALHHRSKYNHP
jgi:hypothetical protein